MEKVSLPDALLAGILEIAQDAIIVIDDDHVIRFFNQGAEKIFGYHSTHIIGQPLNLLLPEGSHVKHTLDIRQFGQAPETSRRMGERREIYGRRRDGSEFPAEASISKLDVDQKMMFTAILRDVSDRKYAEEELRRTKEELERRVKERTEELGTANARLQEKLRDLEIFHDVTVGRELKMVELEKKIAMLEGELRQARQGRS